MEKIRASIDIGTHTARLLIAQESAPKGFLRILERKRVYILLGEDFDSLEKKVIQPRSIERALNALTYFSEYIKTYNVNEVKAVATGVVREASNRKEFLTLIKELTGFPVRLISGNEEALLTGKGVLQALNIRSGPYLIFDLGGGSMEFLSSECPLPMVSSAPLGALLLSQGYLKSDPPEEPQLDELSRYIDKSFYEILSGMSGAGGKILIAGTGGTVTTLAAILNGLSEGEVTPEKVNGLKLEKNALEDFFQNIKGLSLKQLSKIPGLEPEKARVIVAGSVLVIRLLNFFGADELSVSLSDLLEGMLINWEEGEENER